MRTSSIAALTALITTSATGQVRVNPTGVNVDGQGANTVFLTYGGLAGAVPIEALWCGELEPAAPALGQRCAPGSIFGQLPLRYDRSGQSGIDGFTDIMTIPPSVTRRAYQAAEAGSNSAFYYVRRFRHPEAGIDQYVVVTCRMTGGGARTPLSLTDVRIRFDPDLPLLQVSQGSTPPPIVAPIRYTGTGRLIGRWEVVSPGEELPTTDDLLTEATLPLERRGTQRRYAQVGRFNLFLPPGGQIDLPGPDPDRLPTGTDGVYQVLLRIEVSSDKEGDSNLAAAGAGQGVVASGAVAGFPMPVLRYLVGSGQDLADPGMPGSIRLLAPAAGAQPSDSSAITFSWTPSERAEHQRIEIEDAEGDRILSALLPRAVGGYRAPPWLLSRVRTRNLRWRVVAIDGAGRVVGKSETRRLQLGRSALPLSR